MVAGIAPPTPRTQDAVFQARWQAALEAAPADERAIKQKIMDACADIEKKVSAIHRDLRDCNVIMARTVGRCIEFEMKSVANYLHSPVIPGLTRDPAFLPLCSRAAGPRIKSGATIWRDRRG